ncbi:MAG: hypothetical protein CW691_05215 [Candidatus Bathyarchaeum sp.]|nr:MAG: hypothetical protein CW691_05215 [Candidatus Bathyarchaeum sp.]
MEIPLEKAMKITMKGLFSFFQVKFFQSILAFHLVLFKLEEEITDTKNRKLLMSTGRKFLP